MLSARQQQKLNQKQITLQENQQVLDFYMITNKLQVKIPDNLNFNNSTKKIQLISARWDLQISQDGVNPQNSGNLIIEYKQPNCVQPIYQKNYNNPPDPWDDYHSFYFNAVKVYSDIARSWDEKGNCTNLIGRLTRDITQGIIGDSIFNAYCLDANEVINTDTYNIPPNQQFFNVWVTIEIGNFGNIRDPTDPQQIKWKTLEEDDLFGDRTTEPIQPQPNFNRPLYLRFLITYL